MYFLLFATRFSMLRSTGRARFTFFLVTQLWGERQTHTTENDHVCSSSICSTFMTKDFPLSRYIVGIKESVARLRPERHFCSRLPYFFISWLQIFQLCPSELHPLIWFFFINSLKKKKNIQKTTQNTLAPSIFIVLSIVLKLGTPLRHIQAQNTLLQNFKFGSRSRDMDEKPPKTLFYPAQSALTKHNFFRRSKLRNL